MHAYVSASGGRMTNGGHKPRGRGFDGRGSNADPSSEDIDFQSDHRRSRSASKRSQTPTQPLRLSSTAYESAIQNTSRESRYSRTPIRKVATECDGQLSNGRRSSCRGESNDDEAADEDVSGFNEEDYLAGRILTGLVSNRLLVKSSSPPVDTLFKPDISKKSESQKRLRSASVNRVQDVLFKPYEQQNVGDKGRTNKPQHDGIHSKQSSCNKPNSGGRLDQHGCTDFPVVRPGSSQINNAGQAIFSIPKVCTETREREEITKQMNSINQNKPGRFKPGSLPNYGQRDRISINNAHTEDKSDCDMRGRRRQTLCSDLPEKSNDDNSNRKHKSNHETNPCAHVSQEIHNTTSKTGNSSKDHSNDSEKDDTDKVYNYFLYIGTRIPSKSFSRLSRSVNKQPTLVPS